MGFFKRKNRILDLTKRYQRQQKRAEEMSTGGKDMQESSSESNSGGLGFFGAIANTVSNSYSAPKGGECKDSEYVDVSSVDEKKRKLAKRLMEMTNKIEDLSNQIYHLQQRLEVLEKKGRVGGY